MGGCIAAQLLDRLANLVRGRGVRRHRLTERNGHGVRNPPRPFPEEFAALKAEDAAPQTIEMYGNNRNVEVLHDLFEAALEGQHVARPADGAFSENANHVAGREL